MKRKKMRNILIVLLLSIGSFATAFDEGVELYHTGDYSKALEKFLVQGQDGHSLSQYNIGLIYANGLGIIADENEASKWYEQSARQGNGLAQFNLAQLYDKKEDPSNEYAKKAKYWYEQAIHSGINEAYNNLAILYVKGKGVEQSEAKALVLLEKARGLGDSTAQVNLAMLYAWGASTKHDNAKAYSLLKHAESKGQSNAKIYINQLCSQNKRLCKN
jgi:TPR repeat protein